MRKILTALAACLALAACSDEPSETEMRGVVESSTRRAVVAQGHAFAGFESFRKQGCVDSRDHAEGYDCYYAATFTPQPGRPAMSVNGKGWFHRTDKGLSFEDLGAQPR